MTESLWGDDGGAVIDASGRYRYRLWRRLVDRRPARPDTRVLFVMLNPSTADASLDDHTIRCCRRIAGREGGTVLDVVNLYAYRSTSPKVLDVVDDPVGPENDRHIASASGAASLVIVAYGALPARRLARADEVLTILGQHGEVWTLGSTANGCPRHPSRIAADAALEPF